MWRAALEPGSALGLPIRKLSVDDYHAMARAGILGRDERVELLGGQLLNMAPIGPEHQDVLEELTRTFLRQEDGSFRVGPGRPIPIPPHDEPQPGLVIYRAQARSWQAHPSPKDVLLVVEISDMTRLRDLRDKRLLYQRAGIPEYWVVDVNGRAVWVFTLNAQGDYLEWRVAEGQLRPAALPLVTVSVPLAGPGKPGRCKLERLLAARSSGFAPAQNRLRFRSGAATGTGPFRRFSSA